MRAHAHTDTNPSSLELILVWDLVPAMRKLLRALVVSQNLIKTTVSYGSHDWSAHLGDITRKHYEVC